MFYFTYLQYEIFLMDGSYQSSIVRFSLGMYFKQERLIQALGNGSLRATRPRFSRLAASLLATRVLRLLPTINFDEKYYSTLTFLSAVSSSCTDSFIRSLFILLSPTRSRSRVFDKQEARESFNPSYSTWNRWSAFLLTHFTSWESITFATRLLFIAGRITNIHM